MKHYGHSCALCRELPSSERADCPNNPANWPDKKPAPPERQATAAEWFKKMREAVENPVP